MHELESGSPEDLIDWPMAQTWRSQIEKVAAAGLSTVLTAGLYLLVYVYTHTAAMKMNHNCTTL